jgi:hypothetical protein
MSAGAARVPTGRVDVELRVTMQTDAPVPEIQVQSWRCSPATGEWQPTNQPPSLQVQFTQHLAEVLLEQAAAIAPEPDGSSPSTRIPLGPDVEVRVSEAEGELGAGVMLDVALWRCSPDDRSRSFCRTAAGWRIPAHLVPVLVEGLQRVAKRSTERRLFAPAPGAEP